MNDCNFYMGQEDAHFINDEIQFIAGKSGLPEGRVVEIVKIKLLSDILSKLQKNGCDVATERQELI